jgi:proline dehydrogenase
MLQALSRAFFHTLAGSQALKTLASRYGMRSGAGFGRRFIAGTTVDEAIAAARILESQGLRLTLDYLGESVSTLAAAGSATRAYIELVDRIAAAGIDRNISLKLTQLGLGLDADAAHDNLRSILDKARGHGVFVRIDMEDSPHTEETLRMFDRVWQEGYRDVGVVLQSYLRRSEDDLRRVTALGARVRLVKGAYQEPRAVAYQTDAEVDAAYVRMMRALLTDGTYPAIATHDEAIIEETKRFARDRGIAPSRFEFQMLFGVRRDLQASLVRDGYRMRIYVPFGREWFPYFMRRLGERPANVLFVLRTLARERRKSERVQIQM